MSESDSEKVTLTAAEFAAKFGKSETWAYRLLYDGKIQAVTGYGRIMIPRTEVDRILKSAGRYEGATVEPSLIKRAQKKKAPKARRANPWTKAIRSRRTKPAASSRGRNSPRISSARRGAIRKLNRR